MSTPALEVHDLKAGYLHTPILHGITLQLDPGSCIGLFGPNGHGKTTLMRTISGLLKPWSGEIKLHGKPITNLQPSEIVAAGLVHVPQANGLFPYMTVLENLKLGAYSRRARAKCGETLEEVLDLFPRLKERRSQDCRTLSGGERQMVSIGIGLMAQPSVLLLDEPTLGLSPKLKTELCACIGKVIETGVPTIIVEQDISFMMALTRQFYLLNHGEISASFSGDDQLDNAKIMDMYFGLD